ncbi:uncharacterized protein LOC124928826 [Impatiens glandulifera]|uniref:uncharacterized protein LOC124928826 n=1 Tax=Impatiens glandulifera TaxID=253017 RepID=UPI001FB0A1DC|nr:uncharacterized protein LOC124928826 [Impatiens glandulifera]
MEVFSFSEEIHDEAQILQSFKNFTESPIPTVSPSSSSSAITVHKDEAGKTTTIDSDCGMSRFIEVEIVISYLREARLQILNSVHVDGGSKSIVDALIDLVISNLDGMSGDNKDRLPNLVTVKTHILFLLFATCILVAFMIALFSTRGPERLTEPPPT